ncbi:MAG: HD domain-containing protein [Erysipelotrichaceae bacterium]|nr:HD domain-containing protein [Erysipelotrichaceae bacterium]
MQVKDFKEGEHVSIKLLISNLVKGATNSGAPYLTLTLQDSSKAIDAKLWDVKPEIEKNLEVGKVYNFDLEVIKYKNNLQCKVISVLPISQNDINYDDYVFRSNISTSTLRENIQKGINTIDNENLARIVTAALNYYDEKVYQFPAASKIHHNYIGGLATHVSGMLKIADCLCSIYPTIDRNYLTAGIIVHDLGKIEELSSPVVTEYTVDGKLLGHISIMDSRLLEIGKELKLEDSEELLILRHMVLAHHGQYEFGSPVRPETLEAELLFMIDNIDARINILDKALSDIEVGEFTQKIFALDNRVFYKHK